jgi:hypothetical protein
LGSGGSISLDLSNANFDPLGLRVRVEYNVINLPGTKKSPGLAHYEVGGPGARVLVSGPFQAGYAGYTGDDPGERIFAIVKMVGGVAAAPGTPINSGDLVVLRIDSNYGKTFFFRVTGTQSGAEVHGDGTALGQAGTVFTAEFNEARSGLGWRPSVIKCQSCAEVTVTVTRAAAGNPPVAGASVVAQVPNHPFQGITGSNGQTMLIDTANRKCIPDGNVPVQASANRHKTKTVTVQVPDTGTFAVSIQLDCTEVRGKVVDVNGNGVPGKYVYLRDASGSVILDENGNPYRTTTDANGNFVFTCVPHQWVEVWTTGLDPNQQGNKGVVPPEGWQNITLKLQASTCGNLVGTVTDFDTGQPIAGATVTESGGRQTTTNANGEFSFQCVKPAGNNTVYASAPGYTEEFQVGVVPTTGNSNPVNIKLHRISVLEIQIRLDWGLQPSDLDAHLSGPDPAGGRFHCAWYAMTPVPYVQLDTDDTTALGPEIITIRRTPPTAAGVFQAGDYHYWVHNYNRTTFAGSNATVTVSAADAQGNLSQIARYDVVNATGSPTDWLWHVVDLTIDASGNVVRNDVQTFQAGDSSTVL